MNDERCPMVSVVIATRDRLELVRVAVEAVWQQTYCGDVEIIVVFDQSEPILEMERLAEARSVRVMQNSRAPGLAGARNSGILAARGDLVAFCDDDDIWLPEKLKLQIDAMIRAGSLAAVTGIEISVGSKSCVRIPDGEEIGLASLASGRMTGAHPSSYLIRRKELIDKVGLVDEQLPYGYGEDYDLLIRLAQNGKVIVVPIPLVKVLWHSGSYFSQRWRAMSEGLAYLVEKHPALWFRRSGRAWIEGQRAFALAALGDRREGWRVALRSFRLNPREPRAFLAMLILLKIVSAEKIMRILNSRGRGI